jgi:predicted homoserine dehydrogenase-like protein
MTVEDAVRDNAIPCGLLENGKVTKPIRKGELLTYANCAVDATAGIVALRKRQDDMLKGAVR